MSSICFQISSRKESFLSNTLKPLFLLGLVLGLTPFCDVLKTRGSVSYRWLRLQTLYSLTVLLLVAWTTVQTLISYAILLTEGSSGVNNAVTRSFTSLLYLSCLLTNLQCLRATRNFPLLINRLDSVNQNCKSTCGRRYYVLLTIVVLTSSAVVDICLKYLHETISPSETDGSFNIFHVYALLVYTYHDVFISVLSLTLSFNYGALAQCVKMQIENGTQINAQLKWRRLRENHLALSYITEQLDLTLTYMTLQSYAFNVVFLCIKVSLVLKSSLSSSLQLYSLLYSIFHLSLKTYLVSASASAINDQAHAPLDHLFDCPTPAYGKEVYRFIFYLTRNSIGFTGGRFFTVDRRIYLAVLSMVTTYELVLLKLS